MFSLFSINSETKITLYCYTHKQQHNMSWNILAYLIYLTVTTYTILVIGKQLHSNGIYFVRKVFVDQPTANTVNNLLLLAYYLVNIGYAFITLSSWEPISDMVMLVFELSKHIGLI